MRRIVAVLLIAGLLVGMGGLQGLIGSVAQPALAAAGSLTGNPTLAAAAPAGNVAYADCVVQVKFCIASVCVIIEYCP